jgi:hypothetical protein
MFEIAKQTARPFGLAGKLQVARQLNAVTLRDLQFPKGPLRDEDIIASVHAHLPNLPFNRPGDHLATLTTHTPAVDGVASVGFEVVENYNPGSAALIGSLFSDGVSQFETPKAVVTLANAPTGGGNLLTCRVFAGSVGPNFPGFYHVEGPGVSASFTDSANIDTFSFVVPAGGAPQATITIHTDRDRIAAWVFHDCTITQL